MARMGEDARSLLSASVSATGGLFAMTGAGSRVYLLLISYKSGSASLLRVYKHGMKQMKQQIELNQVRSKCCM